MLSLGSTFLALVITDKKLVINSNKNWTEKTKRYGVK